MRHHYIFAAALLLAAGCTADLNDLNPTTCDDWADKQGECLHDAIPFSVLKAQCTAAGLSNACRKCVVDTACSAQATACASACGGVDGGGTIPPVVEREDVTGGVVNTWVQVSAQGELTPTPQAADLSSATLNAWELLPDAGLLSHAGQGFPDGGFRIPGVPKGAPVYVQWGSTYVRTTERSLDFGANYGGRPDVETATQTTPVSVQLTGLAPFGNGNTVELASFNAGLYDFYFDLEGGFDGGSAISPGSSSASWSQDWSALQYTDGLLPDAARGDSTYLLDLVGSSQGNGTLRVLSRLAGPQPVTLSDGAPGSLFANFSAVPATQTLALSWDHASFDAHLAEIGPSATAYDDELYVSVMPGGSQYGSYTFSADLIYYDGTPASGTLPLATTYGNPFPASWDVIGSMYVGGAVTYQVPGASDPYTAHAYLSQTLPVASLTGSVGLTLSPPRNVRVGSGTSPVVRWDAPAVGSPTAYRVIVYRLLRDVVSGGATRSRICSVVVDGSTTQVTLPPERLTPGTSYYVQVHASAAAGEDIKRKPFRYALTGSYADALSPLFSP